MLGMINRLKNKTSDPSSIRVCLVVDGNPLPAKGQTHQKRARASFSHFKRARRVAELFLGKPEHVQEETTASFQKAFRGCAYAWMRWFPELKEALIKVLCAGGARLGFEPDAQELYSVVSAPYEADPVCVWVAEKMPNSIIFSPDGDLLVYPFADESPVCHTIFLLSSTC